MQLNRDDVNFIRADNHIGTMISNTFGVLFVADAFGNRATELNGLQAAAIVADTSIIVHSLSISTTTPQ